MSQGLPPEIESGLVSLRRRIRKVQLFRGFLRTSTVLVGGLLLTVALDYFLAPLPSLARVVLFFLWIAAVVVAVMLFILKPMSGKLTLVRLARWLEHQHPAVQERISTALEISERPGGISPDLLAALSKEAALDMSALDPRQEVRTKRIRRSMWPAAAVTVAILVLVAIWPREMGRLITRAVSPFSELGNVGAFRFEIQPGDLEVLEGDEIDLDFVYTGALERPLELLIEKDGEVFSEILKPDRTEGDRHTFQYKVASADEGFRYSARVAASESDRFAVKVYPLPRLLEPMVTYRYPPYTEWPDRKASLGSGIQALAGTEVTVTGRFETPLESSQVLFDGEEAGKIILEGSAAGTGATWTETLGIGQSGTASLMVKHRLGRELEGARFILEALEDPVPVVEILTPVQREFRVKPDDQITITYKVVEAIGLSKAAIELEVDGRLVEPLLELLPERLPSANDDLWEGEAMVYLGSLVSQYQGAHQFRMRLALSDNRPVDLDGPGVGFSEWLEVSLDNNAESLVRQEFRKQDSDFHQSIEEAVADIHQARQKVQESRNDLNKDELTENAEKKLAEARDKLQETRDELGELTERMKQGVQAHRTGEIEEAIAKLEEAQQSVEQTPLQDTAEARQSEAENALRETEEAINKLQQTRQEVYQDQPKVDNLARLQELAQKQEQLARDAAENDGEKPDQKWQNVQRQVENQIREEVRQSPEAKAAALRKQSEKAKALAEEAGDLKDSQEQLAGISQTPPAPKDPEALAQTLAKEQEVIVEGTQEELVEARSMQEERANDLPEALAQAEAALAGAEQGQPAAAAEAAQSASEELAKGAEAAPSQQALAEKQNQLAEAFEALAEGKNAEALAALEQMQSERAGELAREIQDVANVEGDELGRARSESQQGAQKASRAAQAQSEGNSQMASQQHEQSSQDFAKTQEALEQAAQSLAQNAAEAAEQEANPGKAPAPGEPLAEAFQQSAEAASTPSSSQAAESSRAAADALRQAARQAKANMKQGTPSGQPPAPGPNGPPIQGGEPGKEPDAEMRQAQADQGVPPELARLGISVADWEKIQATLKSEVSGSGGSVVPDDYRGLVKQYFEQVSKER